MSGSVSDNVVWHDSGIPRAERWRAAGLSGCHDLVHRPVGLGQVDGGVGRRGPAHRRVAWPTTCSTATTSATGSTATSGSTRASRVENVRRVAEVARLFADAGVHALVPVISPYRAGREQARAIHEAAGLVFVEVLHGDVARRVRGARPEGSLRQGPPGRAVRA